MGVTIVYRRKQRGFEQKEAKEAKREQDWMSGCLQEPLKISFFVTFAAFCSTLFVSLAQRFAALYLLAIQQPTRKHL
jgi:hypothetical protein